MSVVQAYIGTLILYVIRMYTIFADNISVRGWIKIVIGSKR